MVSCVTNLLLGRSTEPLTLTLIACYAPLVGGLCESGAPSAFSYDELSGGFDSVGVIVPTMTTGNLWASEEYATRGPEAFCAVKDAATTLLHEVVHACVKNRDGVAESDIGVGDAIPFGGGCWQEARMVGNTFIWAMEQRYVCVGPRDGLGPRGLCGGRGDDMYFLLTTAAGLRRGL
jgi:hypothetical protein